MLKSEDYPNKIIKVYNFEEGMTWYLLMQYFQSNGITIFTKPEILKIFGTLFIVTIEDEVDEVLNLTDEKALDLFFDKMDETQFKRIKELFKSVSFMWYGSNCGLKDDRIFIFDGVANVALS